MVPRGKPDIGVNQWFHHEDDRLDDFVRRSIDLRVEHVRTGLFWSDFHRPDGPRWYDRMFGELRRIPRAKLLVSVWSVPPSISASGNTDGPVREDADGEGVPYRAYFPNDVRRMIERYRDSIHALELWNEPNNRYKWNFDRVESDGERERWRSFDPMIASAARVAKERGVPTVLGGMSPVDHRWLGPRFAAGTMEHMDAIGIHAFPGMDGNGDDICWERDWPGWNQKVAYIRRYARGKPLWVTETGFATSNRDGVPSPDREEEQVRRLTDASRASVDRLYWYSMYDLPGDWPSIEQSVGGKVDPYAHHMGLVAADGREKPGYDELRRLLRSGGI